MRSNLAYQLDPEELREELIDGEVVLMSPAATNHNRIVNNLNNIFYNFLRGKPCEPFSDGESVHLTEKDHFIPDFMVVCDPEKVKPTYVEGPPDLVVEILSPRTAKRDRTHKKDVYARSGVREFWIVDPISKSIEIYLLRNGDFFLHDVHVLRPDWELAEMSEEEKAALITRFHCSLFDDLEIDLEDVFYRT